MKRTAAKRRVVVELSYAEASALSSASWWHNALDKRGCASLRRVRDKLERALAQRRTK